MSANSHTQASKRPRAQPDEDEQDRPRKRALTVARHVQILEERAKQERQERAERRLRRMDAKIASKRESVQKVQAEIDDLQRHRNREAERIAMVRSEAAVHQRKVEAHYDEAGMIAAELAARFRARAEEGLLSGENGMLLDWEKLDVDHYPYAAEAAVQRFRKACRDEVLLWKVYFITDKHFTFNRDGSPSDRPYYGCFAQSILCI